VNARDRLLLGIACVAGLAAGAALDAKLLGHEHVRTVVRTVRQTSTMTRYARPPASAIHPARFPWSLVGGGNAHEVVLGETVAADAQLIAAWYPRPHQVLVQWVRDFGDEPPYREFGLTLWAYEPRRSHRYPWQPVWTLRRSEYRERVDALRITLGDLTGDRHGDFLVFVDTDGSGGCGTYLAVVDERFGARIALRRQLCLDQGQIVLRNGRLVVSEGVDFAGPGIHCCYRKTRVTTLRLSGNRLAVVRSRVHRNRRWQWPPR
jgi:hypothetical protein